MKLYTQTFGCKVNSIDTGSMAALLEERGYTLCDRPEEADVILCNSCTVTASGDSRMLHALRRLRRLAPDAVLVLTGCYVQAFPEAAAALPEPDILLGTKERAQLPALVSEFLRTRERRCAIPAHRKGDAFEALPCGTDSGHTRAFLKIQDGCNRFCSYCIIPYARGRCRSLAPAQVRERAAAFAAQGYREIVLCGINLACWGEEAGLCIADAVDACREAGFPRVRLGSLEPDGLTGGVLTRLARNPSFCPQFHISLQSGCDRTLRAMHRHYTCAEYAALLSSIRTRFPRCAITTDIMTGFPGETDADFSETMRFAEAMQFAGIHIFRYSRRPGTAADALPGQLPESVKKARADALTALAQRLHENYLAGCIGETLPVLLEREKGDGFHRGHAPDYSTVLIPAQPGDGSLRGALLDVHITGIRDGQLRGILAK